MQHGIGRYLYDDNILGGKTFALSDKSFSPEASKEITQLVTYHYRMFTNQKAVHLNTLFSSAMNYKTIMEYYDLNKEVINDLKEEDVVAAKAVGDSFKKWAKALKSMEE